MIATTLTVLAVICVILSFWVLAQLLWVWIRIRTHPHVEPVETALPELAPILNQLVMKIAHQARLAPPTILIRRAQLPNAFVIVTIMRAEIYLTDELLEFANEQTDGMKYLIQVLCHEMAHLQNNDSIPLGLLNYLANTAKSLHLFRMYRSCNKHIENIEKNTDLTADILYKNSFVDNVESIQSKKK